MRHLNESMKQNLDRIHLVRQLELTVCQNIEMRADRVKDRDDRLRLGHGARGAGEILQWGGQFMPGNLKIHCFLTASRQAEKYAERTRF